MNNPQPLKWLVQVFLTLALAGYGASGWAQERSGTLKNVEGEVTLVREGRNLPAIPGMEPPLCALCLAPFGMEEGTEVALDSQEFGLVVGEPVLLRFFGSSVRRHDSVGTLLEFWGPEELLELPEIVATLPAEGRAPGEVVPVRLHARVTDIGTLELLAVPVGGSERWKVELQVRTGAAAAGA